MHFGLRRFGLRTLLISTAVVAVACWQTRRLDYLLTQAAYHDSWANCYDKRERFLEPVVESNSVEVRRLQAEFHGKLAEKYRRAVWLPWVSFVDECGIVMP